MGIYAASVRHEDLLARTGWSALEHAYTGEPGARTTPEILAALLGWETGRSRALH